MRYLAYALLLLSAVTQANEVNIVIEGTIQQTGGTGVDPLEIEGASVRIVATYDDATAYDDVYYFNSGGAVYSFNNAVTAIEFGFYNRPNSLPPVVKKYAQSSGGFSLNGTAISSYDDDIYGPGRISIGTINGDWDNGGPLTYLQAVQLQGLWTQPYLPTLAQWSNWSTSYYGQNDPFGNWPSISSAGSDPDSFKYEFIYTNPATVSFYDANSLPPLPGSATPVTIDVNPADPDNKVYPNKGGKLPVAVLSSATFDATQVNPDTVRFGPADAAPAGAPDISQVDGQHGDDTTLDFRVADTGILCNDAAVALTGETYSGNLIEGTDSIDATECESGGCHPY
ncbi:MAG: hypothetical protein ACR2P6_10980 [Gammaproteobacteria bacterium]